LRNIVEDKSENYVDEVKIRYTSLGADHGIGASAHFIKMDRYGILLDTGMDPNSEAENAIPDYEILKQNDVQAIVISHAHFDHIGSLPIAIRNFPHARVYMTPPTAELTEQMLYHYIQVQRKRQKEKGQEFIPIYDEEFVGIIRYIFQSFDYKWIFPFHSHEESGIHFSFYDAGHILGSAGIMIEWRGRKIFYTGNTKKSKQFILKGADYPDNVDLLITEATYGANEEAEKLKFVSEQNRFAALLTDRLKLGGIVLIPVFALGRTQEILTLLNHLRQKKKIPAVPIFITGFGINVSKTYDRLLHKTYPEFEHGNLRRISYGRWTKGKKLQGPAILLFTSGMMIRGTASFEYSRQLAADVKNGIFFVGYADPETPAGLFRQRKYDSLKELFGLESISCKVEIFHFSAHSNRKELMDMIVKINPKTVILTHGDTAAMSWVQKNIQAHLKNCRTILPLQSTPYEVSL
jgi:Cft2 family RNA processing exonuclease